MSTNQPSRTHSQSAVNSVKNALSWFSNATKIFDCNFTSQTFSPDPANHSRFPTISKSMRSFKSSNELNVRDKQTHKESSYEYTKET